MDNKLRLNSWKRYCDAIFQEGARALENGGDFVVSMSYGVRGMKYRDREKLILEHDGSATITIKLTGIPSEPGRT